MRLFIFSLFILLLCQAAAQESNIFIVTEVSGKAQYTDKQLNKEQQLLPGQQLSADASVILANNARVSLVHKNKAIVLNKTGRTSLQTFVNQGDKKNTGLINRFFNYIQEGITNTGNDKKLEKYHEQYITKNAGGVKGFAGGEYGVIASSPVIGMLRSTSVTFSWFATNDSSFYDFQILDYQTDGVIYKALLRDNAVTVELQKLVLEPERKYYWVVQKKLPGELSVSFTFSDEPYKSSPEVEFVIDNDKLVSAIALLEKEEEYQKADALYKKLMEALVFENNQFIYEAYLRLQEAQKLAPDNQLIKNLTAAFLARQGLIRAGSEIINSAGNNQ
ncbi:MAG: hypothetical protein SFU99_00535 [Saprospiraceae bacterium]|nr:hypothetical protein [Saprospiraceae bacterium]